VPLAAQDGPQDSEGQPAQVFPPSNKLNLTEGLPPEDREWLLINGKERHVSPNEALITEGKALQEIYFVLSGLFAVGSKASESFSTVGPGGILGDMSFLTENAASASVAALE
jgi:CRP/FNR family transcriptional regulator, cyclic AMP receptor protein